MKAGIHPDYVDTTITCNCGEVIHTRSTRAGHPGRGLLQVPSVLHGKQRFVDTAGRVERFQRKYNRKAIAEG